MDDRGSILIESVVALGIIAAILAATFQVVGDSARRRTRAEGTRLATMTAQSVLAAAGSTIPIDTASSGSDGTVLWQLDVVPYTVGEIGRAGTPVLVSVTAIDRRDPRARVTLRTVRLARAG